MSIIYDALKKAEKAIHENLKVSVSLKPKDPNTPKHKFVALYILIIILGLGIGNVVFTFLGRYKITPAKENLPRISAQPKKQLETPKPIETAPTPTPPPPVVSNKPQEAFVLNGIFFSRNEGYALINNHIVRMGDTVDGALVLKITADEVELNSGGATVTLTRSR